MIGKREACIAILLAMTASVSFSQDSTKKPSSPPPPQVVGLRLIAWSEAQKPKPIYGPADEPSPESQAPPETKEKSREAPVVTSPPNSDCQVSSNDSISPCGK